MRKFDFRCVVVSHGDVGFPHLESLKKSNVGLEVNTVVSQGTRGMFPNCDRNVYDWVCNNKNKLSKRILFLEYDTRIEIDLRTVFSKPYGDMEGACVYTLTNYPSQFMYCMEAKKLPSKFIPTAMLFAPLGMFMLSVNAAQYLSSDDHRGVFDIDMDSEVRLPSVVRGGGFTIAENPALTHVRCRKTQLPDTPDNGILHPCKSNSP